MNHAVHSQLFTVIPYACATITLVAVNHISDRFQHKSGFIMASISTAIIGYIILMAVENNAARMTACCLVVAGIFPSIILVSGGRRLIWNSLCSFDKKATHV